MLLKDEAYGKLMGMIRSGAITYGYTYSLNQIAEELGMSRTPVRDAVQRLSDENRVELLPSRGFRLHMLTKEELLQMYNFSNAIEGYCIVRLTREHRENGRSAALELLQELTRQLRCVIEQDGSFGAYFELDDRFHREIIESIGDPCFIRLSNANLGFFGHSELQIIEQPPSRELMLDVLHCHEAIISACVSGDELRAYNAMISHADYMYNHYIKYLEDRQ